MGFSIGGGIGPFRYSYRPGRGRSSGSSPEDIWVAIAMLGVGAVAMGAWASVEGITGRWGVTGVVLSIIFMVASFFSVFFNEYAATAFSTSWVYLVLAKLNYFNLLMWPDSWLNTEFQSLDQFVVFLLVSIAYIVTLVLVVASPPAITYLAMRKFHRGFLANLESQPSPTRDTDKK